MVKDEMTPRDHPDMNFRLKPESKMSHYMALLFAAACGMAVANIYFAQPLLDSLADEFGITYSSIGIVITITQLCYAAGLLLIVPLGDLLNRRRLIIGQMLLSVLALILVGIAPIVTVLFLGLAVVGLLAVVTQVLVAFAASWAAPEERGRIVGLVQSGIVTGILLARTFAGVLTDFAGWRSVYLVSAVIMLILTGVLFRVLPRDVSKESHYPMFICFVQCLYCSYKNESCASGDFGSSDFYRLWYVMDFTRTASQYCAILSFTYCNWRIWSCWSSRSVRGCSGWQPC